MRQSFTLSVATVLLLSTGTLIQAQTSSAALQTPAQTQPGSDKKAAAARYREDLKLCGDEKDAAARLQCRRDAKAQYSSALAVAKTRLGASSAPSSLEPACTDCGKVIAVSQTEKEGEAGPVGMIAGGVAGAILGHQVGSGIGKDLATIAGAAGGAYAGKEIEKRVKSHKVWTISVKYPDGQTISYEFAQDPRFKVGDAVKKSGQSIIRP